MRHMFKVVATEHYTKVMFSFRIDIALRSNPKKSELKTRIRKVVKIGQKMVLPPQLESSGIDPPRNNEVVVLNVDRSKDSVDGLHAN